MLLYPVQCMIVCEFPLGRQVHHMKLELFRAQLTLHVMVTLIATVWYTQLHATVSM